MMNKQQLYDKLDELVELFGSDYVLDELSKTLDSDELESDLEYIDQMNDTNLFD